VLSFVFIVIHCVMMNFVGAWCGDKVFFLLMHSFQVCIQVSSCSCKSCELIWVVHSSCSCRSFEFSCKVSMNSWLQVLCECFDVQCALCLLNKMLPNKTQCIGPWWGLLFLIMSFSYSCKSCERYNFLL